MIVDKREKPSLFVHKVDKFTFQIVDMYLFLLFVYIQIKFFDSSYFSNTRY